MAQLRGVSPAAAFERPPAPGNWTAWEYDNLAGAVADAKLVGDILKDYGFEDPVTLYNEQATADAILRTLWKELVCQAAPGDVRVVYYSGHGSYAINQASHESGLHDQTIVPADHWRNTPDVRDKELSRILNAAGKKHVIVTVIADSCHSGALSRGSWNRRGKAKTAAGIGAQPVVVNDPADIDPDTKRPIEPKDSGVVFVSAAQANEEALEIDTDLGKHGAFTWALQRSIRDAPAQRIDLLFERSSALLKADGFSQEPVLEANPERLEKGIFGQSVDGISGLVVSVDAVQDEVIRLRGGRAVGIYKNCRLKRLITKSQAAPVEIRVTKEVGAALAEATAVGGSGNDAPVAVGDQFQVDMWVVPGEAMLKVYVPPAAPAQAVLKTAAEISRLQSDPSVSWLRDATLGKPTHIMSWQADGWILERNPAQGSALSLGPSPSAAAVRKLLPEKAVFLLLVPPTVGLLEQLALGEGNNSAVDVLQSPDGAHYWLEGRASSGGAEFAWVLPDSTEDSVRSKVAAEDRAFPLPIRSDWVAMTGNRVGNQEAAEALTEKALRLGRTRAWLVLPSPAATAQFPYRLALQDIDSKQMILSGPIRGGAGYKIFLQADENDLQRIHHQVPPRWVYVFAIDHFGKGLLIFPPMGRGNDGNRFPHQADSDAQPEVTTLIPLSEENQSDFTVKEPYGVDTFCLLTTEQPIANTAIFVFDGARSEASMRSRHFGDALTQLLSTVGSELRGPSAVPSEWSLERRTFCSVPPKR